MVTSSPVMTAPGLTANLKKRITPLTSADESMETLVVPVTFASTRPAISTLGALISPVKFRLQDLDDTIVLFLAHDRTVDGSRDDKF